MLAHGVINRHELGVAGEYRRGNVVNPAADEPAHRHVEFEIHDVELRTTEERLAEDVLFRRPRPRGQEARYHRLARGLLLRVRHADGRRHDGAEVLHVLHHSFVACRLEVVGRVEAVPATNQHKDGVGVRERWVSR